MSAFLDIAGDANHRVPSPAEKILAGIQADPEGIIRAPRPTDGAAMSRLATALGTLDVNSTYTYIMLCQYFSSTCRVAESYGALAGFVTGFRRPDAAETLFIWQVGVAPAARRRGLALAMLLALLLSTDGPPKFIEATISPSNHASRHLFDRLARLLRCGRQTGTGFDAELFAPETHESEGIFRIGPISESIIEQLSTGVIKP